MKDDIKKYYCQDTGFSNYLYKPLDLVIEFAFLHSGVVKTYEDGLKSRVQIQVYDLAYSTFPESLIEVRREFHFIVNYERNVLANW